MVISKVKCHESISAQNTTELEQYMGILSPIYSLLMFFYSVYTLKIRVIMHNGFVNMTAQDQNWTRNNVLNLYRSRFVAVFTLIFYSS